MFRLYYSMVAHDSILFTRQVGHQSPKIVFRTIARLADVEPRFGSIPEIVDMSNVDGSEFTFDTMRRVAHNIAQEARRSEANKRIAVYAPDDITYGLTRMFSSLLSHADAGAEACAFRTERETLDWMDRPEKRFEDLEGIGRLKLLELMDEGEEPLNGTR